ncbi:MAG: hypothetical protein ACRCTW_03490, partial [Lactococcus garvieae]
MMFYKNEQERYFHQEIKDFNNSAIPEQTEGSDIDKDMETIDRMLSWLAMKRMQIAQARWHSARPNTEAL